MIKTGLLLISLASCASDPVIVYRTLPLKRPIDRPLVTYQANALECISVDNFTKITELLDARNPVNKKVFWSQSQLEKLLDEADTTYWKIVERDMLLLDAIKQRDVIINSTHKQDGE